ncbi:MAG: agmatine deiminase family protein [Bacteroidota bacterium]
MHKFTRLFFGIWVTAYCTIGAAQVSKLRPFTPAEALLKTTQINLPPDEVRTMAEWEEVEGIVIAWEAVVADILIEIIRHAQTECTVYVLTGDAFGLGFYLQTQGVSMEQVELVPMEYNSVWIRDYGPWTVYENDVQARGFSDFLYNRPNRLADDQVPYEMADYLSEDLFNADESPYEWIHTGGNFLRDGTGKAYSSDLVLRENSGKSGLELARFAEVFFGVDDYRILHRLPYDTIHHLDMHIRVLDEETIAFGHYPAGVADGPVIEANLDYLRQNFRTPYGNPYRIMRLEMPADNGDYPPTGDYRTYTNSVFVNGSILVPTYGIPEDEVALEQYRDFFPGYRVVGIDCNNIIRFLGAIHCITKLVGVEEPLYIRHERLRDTYATDEPYTVRANIQHISGILAATLHYRRTGEQNYASTPMTFAGPGQEQWVATIPTQPAGTTIEYYIEAEAGDGKIQRRPLPAPTAFYPFTVRETVAPPRADWAQKGRLIAAGSEVTFTEDAKGNATHLNWSFPGGETTTATDAEVMVQYLAPGTHAVRLIAENTVGSDTLLRTNAVEVLPTYAPFAADFAAGLAEEWSVAHSLLSPTNWEPWTASGCADACLRVPHRDATQQLNRAYLRTAIDLTGYISPTLHFKTAYAQRTPQQFEELRVNLINEAGEYLNIYNKGGDVLATVDAPTPDFTPTNCSHWRSEEVDLTPWRGQVFVLEFESIGDQGNSVYLDEVELRANALPTVNITSPSDQTTIIGAGEPTTVAVTIEAEDFDGEIVAADFFANDVYLGTSTTAPFDWSVPLPAWGDYQIRVRVTDNEEAQAWAEPVRVRYDYQNSLFQLELPLEATLSPNPATDQVTLLIDSPGTFIGMQIELFNANGQLLRSTATDVAPGPMTIPFDVANLPPGSYHFRLWHGPYLRQLSWVKG